jgi:hypothetical protein
MAYFEEPKKGKQSDSKQSPMYKVAAERKIEEQKKKADLTAKKYIADVDSARKRIDTGKASELEVMQESMPMSNKTIEYYHNRYQEGRLNKNK